MCIAIQIQIYQTFNVLYYELDICLYYHGYMLQIMDENFALQNFILYNKNVHKSFSFDTAHSKRCRFLCKHGDKSLFSLSKVCESQAINVFKIQKFVLSLLKPLNVWKTARL